MAGKGKGLWLWLVVAGLALSVLILWLVTSFPDALRNDNGQVSLVYQVMLLVFIGSAMIVRWRAKPGQALRYAAIWLGLGAVLFLGYAFKDEAGNLKNRVMAELMPSRGAVAGGSISFRAQEGGHFIIEALVDGTPVRFLLDTGASDVVLSPRDAERLGFDLSTLTYNRIYRTANGTVSGAPVRLGSVAIGPVLLRDVRASVNGAEIGQSLLGMSFLQRLGGYSVSGDRLTLRR